MTRQLVAKLINKLADYSSRDEIQFYWHGGEPLLNGLDFFEFVVEQQRAAGIMAINLLQTNGVSLNEAWVEFFDRENFGVGVSIDGPPEIHDVFRRDHAGRGSFTKVLSGIRLLQDRGINPICYAVIQQETSGADLVSFFYQEGIHRIDLILPMNNHSNRNQEASIRLGNVLVDAFRRWQSIGDPQFYVKKFVTMREIADGRVSSCCMTRDSCHGIATIEVNGEVCLCDDLKPAGSNYRTNLNIENNTFQEIASEISRIFKQRRINTGRNARGPVDVLRKWCPATRWHLEKGFDETSVDFLPLAMLYSAVTSATVDQVRTAG